MNSSGLSQIERKINQLSREEQLWLIERIVHRLRKNNIKERSNLDNQLAAMAHDPEIQEEMRRIEKEFALTETNGLEKL
ncbi:MAG: hypothetical protein ACUZ8N_05675 [Candidatus Scalindua sp.]